MAARRKSAKPTNKHRQQVPVEEDNSDDTDNDFGNERPQLGLRSTTPNFIEQRPTQDLKQQACPPQDYSTPRVTLAATVSGTTTDASVSSAPHIALPSDIYQDFEALKSVTRLDSTQLMRRLLKDYHRITKPTQTARDKSLVRVIDNLFTARSVNALDLSKRSPLSSPSCHTKHPASPNNSQLASSFTDDQLAMGALDIPIMTNTTEAAPLDLTLHKHEIPVSPNTFLGVRHSLNSSATIGSTKLTVSSQNERTTPYRETKSYVINLEPGNETSSSLANSSLAKVLQMSIPLQNIRQNSPLPVRSGKIASPGKDLGILSSSQSLISEKTDARSYRSGVHLRSKLFYQECEAPLVSSGVLPEHNQTSAVLSPLPSYAEAVSSVMNINHRKEKQIGAEVDLLNSGLQCAKTSKQEVERTLPSTMQLRGNEVDMKIFPVRNEGDLKMFPLKNEADVKMFSFKNEADVKMFPFSFHPAVFSAVSSSEDHKQHQNILQQLLQSQSSSEQKLQHEHQVLFSDRSTLSPSSEKYTKKECQSPWLQSSITKPEATNVLAIKGGDLAYPNFLIESHPVSNSASPSIASSVTVNASSMSMSSQSIPVSTFFMTTATSDGMGHMVAIPVLHALPEGVQGLQPFAFAPHPVSVSNSTPTCDTSSSELAITSSLPKTPDTSMRSSMQITEKSTSATTSLSPFSMEARSSTPPPTPVKPKPGRPRGRGGRSQAHKAPNKDMKLLTENTLFPGVYTSILKLPWSRRSRNKTRTKSTNDVKNQAQIMELTRANEAEDTVMSDECKGNDSPKIVNQEATLESSFDTEAEACDNNQYFGTSSDTMNQIQQQKLKDLEQQQRLHFQYHLRLQEEQRKLAKQIEQSYLSMNPNATLSNHFAVSVPQLLVNKEVNEPSEIILQNTAESDMDSAQNIPYSLSFNQPISPQNPTMVVCENSDAIGSSQKTHKRRGRPPKVTNHSPKAAVFGVTFPSTDVTPMEREIPANFLHTEMPRLASARLLDNILQSSTLTALSLASVNPTTDSGKWEQQKQDSDLAGLDMNKNASFLTSQAILETTKSAIAADALEAPSMSSIEMAQHVEANFNPEGSLCQEMKLAVNKSLVSIKPRRKKVSRLLKSDENFMYATFKIKPKGLTPRKTRRRRKDVLAKTAAIAESIANLRQKSAPKTDHMKDNSKTSLLVSWKFHEQFPCPNDHQTLERVESSHCAKCGQLLTHLPNEDLPSELCESCHQDLFKHSSMVNDTDPGSNRCDQVALKESDLKAECCVTCGNMFQKHLSDPRSRCNTCRSITPGTIKSSKLFSFQDSFWGSTSPDLQTLNSSASASTSESLNDSTSTERQLFHTKNVIINNNHLFCSICRSEFSKISEYLTHIRDKHEAHQDVNVGVLANESPGGTSIPRKTKIFKTKKSLSHKTLTCPVEECPHFFREQKDLDQHFTKKHSNLRTCPHPDCDFIASAPEELSVHLQYLHGLVPPDHVNQGHGMVAPDHVSQGHALVSPDQVMQGRDSSPSDGDVSTSSHVVSVESSASCSEKPLLCPFCDYRCRQKNALTWHMRKHPEAASQYMRYNTMSLD